MWKAKKSILPSIAMGDIDFSSEDEEENSGDKDDDELSKALQRSFAHNFLDKSPHGLSFLYDKFDLHEMLYQKEFVIEYPPPLEIDLTMNIPDFGDESMIEEKNRNNND